MLPQIMASADAGQPILTKFYLYSTASRYYLVGRSKLGTWSVCTLLRGETDLLAHETTSALSQRECGALLRQIHAGNSLGSHGGLQLVCKAYGVIGCAKFLEGHYLLLVTKRQYQGSLCGHKVYSISDTALVPLMQASAQAQESMAEKRYRKLLLGMDLTQDFFFSYTYNIAATLQKNLTMSAEQDRFDSMFVWNDHLTKPLRLVLGNGRWVVPLIHGFWQQRTLAVFGQTLTITLVARRSRHFAGTRYQKRGVNHEGRVANDVETEQIVWAGVDRRNASPSLSSVVQVRGSIPLYWSQQQQGSRLSKPDILLQTFDPLYSATRAHFEDMQARYGSPMVCLDLVKAIEKHPREIALRSEFGTAISYINQAMPAEERVHHVPFDLNFHAKQHGSALLDSLVPLLDACLDVTGLLVHKSSDGPQVVQQGVLRTNCIDCLDRTNVAQFAAGLAALGRQLAALGVSDGPSIDARSSLARHLMDLYEATGNTLARQYGGSEAHSTFFQRQRGDWEAATQGRDLMTSIRRFYSNAYTDSEKQAAINLFLGNFVPQAGRPALWDLDSDYYLHYSSGTSLKRAGSSSGSLSRAASAELARSASAGGEGAADPGSPIQAGSLWRLPGAKPHAGPTLLGAAEQASHFGRRRSLDGASGTTRAARVLAEEAAAAEMLRRAAHAKQKLRPLRRQPVGGGGASPFSSPQRRSQQQRQQRPPPLWTPRTGSPQQPRPGSPPQAGSPVEHRLAASDFEESQLEDSQHGDSQPGSPMQAAEAAPGAEAAARAQVTAAGGAGRLPGVTDRRAPAAAAEIAPAQGGPPPVVAPPPARRRAKLESLDKLIGQQPDVVHHVRLHAAPSQRAYLPQWLAAPLGRRKPDQAPSAAGPGALPPIAEHGSTTGSRRISDDLSHLKASAAPPPPLSRVRRTQSTDSGLLRLVRSVHQAPERRVGGSPGVTVHAGDSLWEWGDSLPLQSADRSDTLVATGAGPRPPSPPLRQAAALAPATSPDIALTDAVAAGRATKVKVSAPKLGALLAGGPAQLGISPFLLAYWVGSQEHFAAFFAAETALAKHYSRFIADTQSFLEPPNLRKHYEDLCQMPPLVEGI